MDINKLKICWFLFTLSTTDYKQLTPLDISRISDFIKSDGCTGVPDWFLDDCIVHDWWYRMKIDFNGSPISREEADKRYRWMMQRRSVFGVYSPMAWWRWAGVKLFGKSAWQSS